MKNIIFLSFALLFTCSQAPEEQEVKKANNDKVFKNVVILLDLSSRVKILDQSKKDQEIIKGILDIFENDQRKYAFMASKDRLSVSLAYQNSSSFSLYNIGNNKFVIDMEISKDNRINKPEFDKKRHELELSVADLYNKAIKSPTDGADVWAFFCTDWVNIYQPQMRNKIIILTDGYLQFDSKISGQRQKGTYMTGLNLLRNNNDWEKIFTTKKLKLKPCANKFENTEVLVLEVAPKDMHINTNEFQIINNFWKTWFNDMKIESTIYKTDDVSANIKGKIQEFLVK